MHFMCSETQYKYIKIGEVDKIMNIIHMHINALLYDAAIIHFRGDNNCSFVIKMEV